MKRNSRKPLVSILSLLVAVLPARAQQASDGSADLFQFMEQEAAITVASAKPETVFNSVSNVTVIDRDTIERFNFANVADAVQTVAGVSVGRTYVMQHIPTFRGGLQEHYANKVLVMIDNVPAWHAVTGEGDIDRVGIDAVERIEILRGPASVLYGSNALNGAINIVLRKPRKGKRMMLGAVGVGNEHDGFSGLAQVSKAAGVYARGDEESSLLVAGDYSAVKQPHFTFSDETRTVFELREYLTTRNMNAHWTRGGSSLLVNVTNSEQDFGGNSISRASGAQNPHTKEMELVNYSYSFGPNWGNLKYSGTWDRQHRQISRDSGDLLRSDILGSRYVNALSAQADLPGPFSLELGGEHEYRVDNWYNNFVTTSQAVAADNSMNHRLIWEGSLYTQLHYDEGPWKLILGSRFTHNQIFGDDLSSRGSAVFMIDERNSLKLMAGQAFRAPTPFELYFQPNPVTVLGNPGLRPEKTSSIELSYLTQWERLFAQATVFYEEYKNAIFRDLGNFTRDGVTYAGVNFYSNASRYNAKGAELELRYIAARTSAFGALDYIQGSRGDAHDIASPGGGLTGGQSYNFKYVPRYNLKLGVSHSVSNPLGKGDFFGSLTAIHSASVDTLRTRLPNQAWADASVGYRHEGLKHTLAVHNVTGSVVQVPEYVRQRVVESMPLVRGRRIDYTISYQF